MAFFGLFSPACLRFQSGPSVTLDARERVQLPARGQLHVVDLPAREPIDAGVDAVVLVHGYGSSTRSYEPMFDALTKHYRVIALDLPGFGLSDRRPGDYSPDALADVVRDVLDKKGVHRIHLVGHSWGASIVLAFALRHPERLARLVVISGWLYEDQILPFMRWGQVSGIGEALYATQYTQLAGEKLYLNFYDPRWVTATMVDEVKRNFHRPGTVAAALAAARGMHFSDREKRHREITNETLLVWGAEDRVARPVFGERLAGELPRARLVMLPACGHIPMIECRGPTAAALVDFLATPSAEMSSRGPR
jgi:pimeloyl-ACP methyl ester carboxylesterase